MKKRTVFLIVLVIFFPLNNLPSFASDAADNVIPSSELFEMTGTQTTTDNDILHNYLDCFSVISEDAMKYALSGYAELNNEGKINKKDIITIVDFSLPSTQKRLFVINLNKKEVLFNTYVAHGINSGKLKANKFSNSPESYKSSLGFYQTLETYMGGHGYSLRLQGLEKGINDNAKRRGIVIHGADYVDENFIRMQGYIGRSWGCPALPVKLYKPIINTIKNGTCLFIYSPDKFYLKKSGVINA